MIDVRLLVKAEIENRGFSRAAIAKKAAMTPQQLSDILNLRRKLSADEMFALCDAMGIEYGSLNPAKHNRTA